MEYQQFRVETIYNSSKFWKKKLITDAENENIYTPLFVKWQPWKKHN